MIEPRKPNILTPQEMDDLELKFIEGADRLETDDPDAPKNYKRTTHYYNKYEFELCTRAAKIENRNITDFIRCAWMDRAKKSILKAKADERI